MSEIVTVGPDLAKNVFQVHVVLAFFEALPPCVVTIEACGGAHSWGREIGKLGHEVRLIPPADVKPFVSVKSEKTQDATMASGVRELLIAILEDPESGLLAEATSTLQVLLDTWRTS